MKTLSAAELYLQDFHQRVTGATSAAFAGFSARSGSAEYPSSYAVLASSVPDSNLPLTVLDLSCGDGHLLKLLAQRDKPSVQLIGVDISPAELNAARTLLSDDVTLLQDRAQALSIATGTVDYVLSHMALMLMDDIEQVVAEVRRVLRPCGGFSAVVGRRFLLGEANEVFLDAFRPIAREDGLPAPFGDRRTGTQTGWNELLSHGFVDIQFEDIDVGWEPSPTELWNSLLETYDIDRLSQTARERLRERLLEAVSHLQRSDGTIRTGWGLRLVRARTA